jgi:hypothetical protein
MKAIAHQWRELELQIQEAEKEVSAIAFADDSCQRLQSVPGVGLLVATAMDRRSPRGGTFPHGWGSFHGNAQPVVRRNFSSSRMRKNEGWQVAFPLRIAYAGLLGLKFRASLGGFAYPNGCFWRLDKRLPRLMLT